MTSPTAHAIEIGRLRSMGWVATCVCGWIGRVATDRATARTEARGHAPGAPLTEPEPATTAPPTGAQAVSKAHHREQSEMVRGADGTLTFRAVCACGWKSGPVDMSLVVLLWDDHIDATPAWADGPSAD